MVSAAYAASGSYAEWTFSDKYGRSVVEISVGQYEPTHKSGWIEIENKSSSDLKKLCYRLYFGNATSDRMCVYNIKANSSRRSTEYGCGKEGRKKGCVDIDLEAIE